MTHLVQPGITPWPSLVNPREAWPPPCDAPADLGTVPRKWGDPLGENIWNHADTPVNWHESTCWNIIRKLRNTMGITKQHDVIKSIIQQPEKPVLMPGQIIIPLGAETNCEFSLFSVAWLFLSHVSHRFPFHPGGGGCVRPTLHLCLQPFATIRGQSCECFMVVPMASFENWSFLEVSKRCAASPPE